MPGEFLQSAYPRRCDDRRRHGRRPRRCPGPRPGFRRAFLEIEILGGLFIVAALALALAAVLGRQHRAVLKLADTRAAMQVAETVLTDLQAGRAAPPPASPADTSVEVRPAVGANAPDPASGKWIEVVVNVRAGRASLIGLVPASTAATAKPTGGAP